MTWTPEQENLLRQRWAEGKSAREIALELGYISRNRVIMKVHSLGLGAGARPQHQQAALIARIQDADTLDALKAVLVDLVKSGAIRV